MCLLSLLSPAHVCTSLYLSLPFSERALSDAEEVLEALNSYVTNMFLQREANLQDVEAYEQLLAQSEGSLANVIASIADAKREVEEERKLRIKREEQQSVLSEVLELPSRQETTAKLDELEIEILKLQEEESSLRRQEIIKRKNLAVLAEVCDAFIRSASSTEGEMFDTKTIEEVDVDVEGDMGASEEDEDDMIGDLLEEDDALVHEDTETQELDHTANDSDLRAREQSREMEDK